MLLGFSVGNVGCLLTLVVVSALTSCCFGWAGLIWCVICGLAGWLYDLLVVGAGSGVVYCGTCLFGCRCGCCCFGVWVWLRLRGVFGLGCYYA